MTTHRIIAGIAAAFALALAPAASAQTARADLQACAAQKRAAFTAPRDFQSPVVGVTCAAAEVVGFPPEVRRDNRSAVAEYRAPAGFTIVPGSVRVCDEVNQGGSRGEAFVTENGAVAQAPVSCRGGGLGEGARSVTVRICGQEVAAVTREQEFGWLVACAQELNAQR